MKRYLLSVALLLGLSAPAWSATYYVATDGNNASAGTATYTAWATMDKATSTMVAGDTTYVRGGTYRENTVVFDNSGNADDGYITLMAYPGETPTIDGSTHAGGAFVPVLYADGKSYIIVDGIDVTGTAMGISFAFAGPGSNIILRNGEVSGHTGNMAIWIVGDGALKRLTNVTVDNMYVHNCNTGSYEAIRFDKNVRYFKAVNCRTANNTNIGIDAVGWQKNFELNPMYGLFQGNTCTGSAAGNGLYGDGASRLIIQHNKSYSNSYGVSIGAETDGDTQTGSGMRYNVVYKNLNAGLTLGNGTLTKGRVQDCWAFHNTFVNNTATANCHDLAVNYTLTGQMWGNNIIYSDDNTTFKTIYSKGFFSDTNSITANYNRYFPTDAVFESVQGNSAGFDAYQTRANPNESASTAGDPGFTDVDNLDFTLTSDSACVDAAGPVVVTTDSGTGTAISVDSAAPITNGFDGLFEADEIIIGTNLTPVAVSAVDYAANTITIASDRSWAAGDGIAYYSVGGVRVFYGTAGDIGADELEATNTPTPTHTPTPTYTPTPTPTPTPTATATPAQQPPGHRDTWWPNKAKHPMMWR